MVFRANPDFSTFPRKPQGEGSEQGALKLDQPDPDLFTVGLTINITWLSTTCSCSSERCKLRIFFENGIGKKRLNM